MLSVHNDKDDVVTYGLLWILTPHQTQFC